MYKLTVIGSDLEQLSTVASMCEGMEIELKSIDVPAAKKKRTITQASRSNPNTIMVRTSKPIPPHPRTLTERIVALRKKDGYTENNVTRGAMAQYVKKSFPDCVTAAAVSDLVRQGYFRYKFD